MYAPKMENAARQRTTPARPSDAARVASGEISRETWSACGSAGVTSLTVRSVLSGVMTVSSLRSVSTALVDRPTTLERVRDEQQTSDHRARVIPDPGKSRYEVVATPPAVTIGSWMLFFS